MPVLSKTRVQITSRSKNNIFRFWSFEISAQKHKIGKPCHCKAFRKEETRFSKKLFEKRVSFTFSRQFHKCMVKLSALFDRERQDLCGIAQHGLGALVPQVLFPI